MRLRRAYALVVLASLVVAVGAANSKAADDVLVPASSGLLIETLEGVVTGNISLPYGPGDFEALPDGGAVFTVEVGEDAGVWIVHPGQPAFQVNHDVGDFEASATGDGGKVVFARWDASTESADIYVVNGDGTDLQRLTDGRGLASFREPTFSPDGSTIAYTCSRSALQPYIPAPCGPQLDGNYWDHGVILMNADGSNKRLILRPMAYALSWSHDGQWLALTADIPVYLGRNQYTDVTPMFLMKTDGSDLFADASKTRLIKVSDDPYALIPALPTFSNDDTRVLFMGAVPAENANFMYIINRDGTNMRRLPLFAPGSARFIPAPGGGGPSPTIDATHIAVPYVSGETFPVARRNIQRRHLNIESVHRVFSATVPRGRVAKVRPRAGVKMHRTSVSGPYVTVFISRGPRPRAHRS